ncbi:hypothetical protein [Novosphingobium sp. PASSN1]|uniref:hypothetical protein n=1 Tax=Novosphingobium sp. PASSN1 TaxID=2015561 RepID=UPI000BD0A784|nr:hypothetical protein [Novosphingobium sp. PASSN1]OYU33259.1 MAG: hypothetical protein CFE35_21020 [Novosphingobium sp. PASSN1]
MNFDIPIGDSLTTSAPRPTEGGRLKHKQALQNAIRAFRHYHKVQHRFTHRWTSQDTLQSTRTS